MKPDLLLAILLSIAACPLATAQSPAYPANAPQSATPADPSPVPLDFVPPAMDWLSSQAASKSSFSFDRSMLAAFGGLIGGNMDDPTKHAIASLDGVSLHILHFAPEIPADPVQIDAIRQTYHLRGWKHVITTTAPIGGPIHDATTDVWIVLDGANVRGAVILVNSQNTLTLATVAGNLSPEDLLHLRGHFGIPRFEGDDLGHAAR